MNFEMLEIVKRNLYCKHFAEEEQFVRPETFVSIY